MPDGIKYSTTVQSNSLQKGNVAIGVGSVGPTSTTNFYSAPTPQSGKYVVSKVAVSGVPNFFTPNNEAEMIRLARQEGATGANTASLASCLAWFATQTNYSVANLDYENIVTDGLILNLDAGFTTSYPTTGTTWYDLSGNSNNGTLTNGPTFNSANSGSIVLDGTNDYINVSRNINLEPNSVTMQCVFYINNMNSGNYPGIISKGYWDSQTSPKDIEGYSMHIRPNYNLWVDFNNNGTRKILQEGQSGEGINVGITQNSLNFITVTIGPTGATIYNKGIKYYSDNTNYTIVYTGDNGGIVPANLWIGWMQYQGGTLNGNIYNAIIYNRALSDTEILQNYNAQKGRFGL
jgi:hypothetical protein